MSPTPLSLDSLLASTLLGFVLALGLVNLARGPRAWRRAGFGLAGLAALIAYTIGAGSGLLGGAGVADGAEGVGIGLIWAAVVLLLRRPLGLAAYFSRIDRGLPWLAGATVLAAMEGLVGSSRDVQLAMPALQLVFVLPAAVAAVANLRAGRGGAAWTGLALACHALSVALAGAAVLGGAAWLAVVPTCVAGAAACLLCLHLGIQRALESRPADIQRELALQEERLRGEQARFFAFVAHELRSPLGVLLTGLVNLRRALPDADTAARIGRLSHAAQRMNGLIDRHLQLQNLSRSDFQPDLADEPPDLPAREALQAQGPLHPGRHFECVHLGDIPVAVPLDAGLVRQALSTLLDNAAKYAFADSPITLEVDGSGGALTYRVINQGPGLPPELAGQAFVVVPRRAGAGCEKGGFGIGLALAAKAASAHGGQLAARQDGARTIFTLTVPLVQPAVAPGPG
jgi:signal transduction histidine kinase